MLHDDWPVAVKLCQLASGSAPALQSFIGLSVIFMSRLLLVTNSLLGSKDFRIRGVCEIILVLGGLAVDMGWEYAKFKSSKRTRQQRKSNDQVHQQEAEVFQRHYRSDQHARRTQDD